MLPKLQRPAVGARGDPRPAPTYRDPTGADGVVGLARCTALHKRGDCIYPGSVRAEDPPRQDARCVRMTSWRSASDPHTRRQSCSSVASAIR
jgi:hypothetical protein